MTQQRCPEMRAKELVFLHCMYVHVLAHAHRGKLVILASLVQAGGVSISVLQKKKKKHS